MVSGGSFLRSSEHTIADIALSTHGLSRNLTQVDAKRAGTRPRTSLQPGRKRKASSKHERKASVGLNQTGQSNVTTTLNQTSDVSIAYSRPTTAIGNLNKRDSVLDHQTHNRLSNAVLNSSLSVLENIREHRNPPSLQRPRTALAPKKGHLQRKPQPLPNYASNNSFCPSTSGFR